MQTRLFSVKTETKIFIFLQDQDQDFLSQHQDQQQDFPCSVKLFNITQLNKMHTLSTAIKMEHKQSL